MLSLGGLKALRPALVMAALVISLTACVRYEPVQIRHQWTQESARTMLKDSLTRTCYAPWKPLVQVTDDYIAYSYVIDYQNVSMGNGLRKETTTYRFRRLRISDIESVQMAIDDRKWLLPIALVGLVGPLPFHGLVAELRPVYNTRLSSYQTGRAPIASAVSLGWWKQISPFWVYDRCYPYETELYRMGEALQFLVNQQQSGKVR